ncbi:DUF6318 family protein [Geodermatophilus sp. CPCC 206100]|uniref:DUF6318 family protein n=1 Tax=Geodermatophilus sp. CPCC 206100 TaxID=3020054 RepID=UPI003AFFF5F5
MARRAALRMVAGLTAGVALLGGCAQEQPASDTLPSASAASPSTDAGLPPLGPADLPMPDEARTQDAAGAEAFVRYYIDLINRTSTVMDAAPLREFSDGCRDCDRIAIAVEQDAAAGYQYAGGSLNITAVGSPLMKEGAAELALRADQAPLVVKDASGAPIEDLETPEYLELSGGVALAWDSNRESWTMTTLTLE